MKKVAVLGSTGSVGTQTLDVIRAFPEKFEVVSLAAGSNVDLLAEQIREFRPRYVSVKGPEEAEKLRERVKVKNLEVLYGEEGNIEVACLDEVELVVCAISGIYALRPVYESVKRGKKVALANKESLVTAGEVIMREAGKNDAMIIPVDSEHNSIFQVLEGRSPYHISKITLTASGGPFLNYSPEELEKVTIEQALQHPVWQMGKKITVDSATLMNKGFEVIEAYWLFRLDPARINVLVHPQSIVHAMVEMVDGATFAVCYIPDMRIPIIYALSYPDRWHYRGVKRLNLEEVGNLEFFPVEEKKFHGVKLAYEVLEEGGTSPAVMCASNEIAVEAFLEGRIKFTDIMKVIYETLLEHKNSEIFELDDVLDALEWAQVTARSIIRRFEA